ncbi:MAG: serine protein kinase [Deltaproteobacteria bacterium]|nr:serine protein kinase [Deltaproteobacteria bacterium]
MAKTQTDVNKLIAEIAKRQNVAEYQDLHWQGSFADYLELVSQNPAVIRTAFQRIYDMILSYGQEEYIDHKKKIVVYNFFKDELNQGNDAIFGLDISLMRLVNVIKSAAHGYGPERRVILLHGPVGSSKSTIVRLLKKGLENYSRTPAGRLFTFEWVLPPELKHISGGIEHYACPMHEEPLHLIPEDQRDQVLSDLVANPSRYKYSLHVEGELDPSCRQIYRDLMAHYKGDWSKVVSHVKVKRLVMSEKDRVGIGTFQPKDEKNQDSTELTGDINYRKIAEFGSDSDPRAFNFDGEFNIANRGIVEFIEILKLDVAFLYDLLGATQEHKIKPKKFAQTDIDEVIIGHTNEAEYRKLLNNEFMEALRDRTIKVDVPYITRFSEETKIYTKDYATDKIRGKHIAPHTLEMAAMWAVLTRLEQPKRSDVTLLQKLKLYDGKLLPGFTQDHVKELRKETTHEAMEGISPRYIQDKLSNALVSEKSEGCINPFMVLRELESGLKHHSLITSEEERERYRELLSVVKQEYEELVKNEVQRAVSADERAIETLCDNYLENVKAYTQEERVKDRYTGESREPDEHLMRSIEEKIDIAESRKDDFRLELMKYIGALSLEGKKFDYKSNERLRRALELKLFEDRKDAIKLSSVVSSVVDREDQAKIDVIKNRMIRQYGYCEICSTDVLNYVASIFARGDAKE